MTPALSSWGQTVPFFEDQHDQRITVSRRLQDSPRMQPLQSSTSAWKEVIDGDQRETSISNKLDAEGGRRRGGVVTWWFNMKKPH